MGKADALVVACDLVRRPAKRRALRNAPLPEGVGLVLEIAANDADAVAFARQLTGHPADQLRQTASFFLEQVLFTAHADHYRVLGASRAATTVELRRHMALLMRWLHPDASAAQSPGWFDHHALVTRVSAAWHVLKSAERRAAYDATLPDHAAGEGARVRHAKISGKPSRRARLSLYPVARDSVIGRLLLLLPGFK